MTTHTDDPPWPEEAGRPQKTKGELYEGIAFTFCKAATIILLTQKFALPVAAGAAALFYILADRHGKKDTRCILKVPLLIAAFWGAISLGSLYLTLRSIWAPGG
jgi:hypothetical protein